MILLEIAALALLLLLLPLGSSRQLRHLDPSVLRRIPAYLESMVAIGAIGALGLWLGERRWGLAGLGLAPVAGWSLTVGRALVLTGVAILVLEAFDRWRVRSGRAESAYVQALMPRSGAEKGVFAALSIMAGVGEEIAYRGFALLLVSAWTGSLALATVVTALAFGWVHAYQGTFGRVRAAVLGGGLTLPVLLGWGLWPAILAHTFIDWIGGLVLGSRWIEEPPPENAEAEWRST
ncbi:MAG: CPBP family intramembrane glutamic endopeptidase [Gemmatimonadota bacterium]